jgi:hypothetical protein
MLLNITQATMFQAASETGTLRRHNVGSLFRYQQRVITYDIKYVHQVVLDLPKIQSPLPSQGDLHNDPDTYNIRYIEHVVHNAAFNPTAELMMKETEMITTILEDINNLFPYVDITQAKRSKRTWCLVYCSNLATQTDLQLLQAYAENSSRINAENFEKIQTSITNMASFSQITNEKFQALDTIIRKQQLEGQLLRHRSDNTLQLMSYFSAVLLPNLLQLTSLQDSLLLLKSKIITYHLLPLTHARNIWAQIKDHVSYTPNHYVAEEDVTSIYNNKDFTLLRSNDTLHISLKIKISTYEKPLFLFKHESINMQYPEGTHSTRLNNVPAYIAINDWDNTFLTFESAPTLEDNIFYDLKKGQHRIISKEVDNCVWGLLIDDLEMIHKTCETIFKPSALTPFMYHMENQYVVLSHITQYSLKRNANDTQRMDSNCTWCIQQFPCNSIIQYREQIIQIPDCTTAPHNEMETVYTLNLQVIAPLLTTAALRSFSSAEFYADPIRVQLPDLPSDALEDEIQVKKALELLGNNSLYLVRNINQTLRKDIVFAVNNSEISTDWIARTSASISSGWQSTKSWLSDPFGMTSKLLTLLQIAGIAFLFWKTQSLNTAIILLQAKGTHAIASIQKVNSSEIQQRISFIVEPTKTANVITTGNSLPAKVVMDVNNIDMAEVEKWLQYLREPARTIKSFMEHQPQLSDEYHTLDALIIIMLMAIFLYLVTCFAKKQFYANTTDFFLEFINDTKRLSIHLGNLPHSAMMYTFHASSFVENVEVGWGFLPKVKLTWSTLTMKHKHLRTVIRIPLQCRINWLQALTLRRILASRFELLIFVKDAATEEYKIMPLTGSTWHTIQQRSERTDNERDGFPPAYV